MIYNYNVFINKYRMLESFLKRIVNLYFVVIKIYRKIKLIDLIFIFLNYNFCLMDNLKWGLKIIDLVIKYL